MLKFFEYLSSSEDQLNENDYNLILSLIRESKTDIEENKENYIKIFNTEEYLNMLNELEFKIQKIIQK